MRRRLKTAIRRRSLGTSNASPTASDKNPGTISNTPPKSMNMPSITGGKRRFASLHQVERALHHLQTLLVDDVSAKRRRQHHQRKCRPKAYGLAGFDE